MALAAHNF
jgi:hypothetical protein